MKQYRMNHDASGRVFSLLTIGDNGAMTMEHHYYEHTEVYEQVTMKYIWVIGERTEVKNGKTVCLKKFLPGMESGRWKLVVCEPFIDTERIKEFCKKPMVKDIGLVLGATAGTLLILHLGLALPFAILGLIAGGVLK